MIHKSFDEMTGKGEASTDNFRLEEMKMWLTPTYYLDFNASIVITDEGEKVGWFVFTAYYPDWQFLSDEIMFSLIDGQRLQVEGVTTYSDTREDRDEIMCVEVCQMPADLDWLAQAAKSTSAKFRVIGRDFELTQEMKNQISELLDAVA